MRDNTDKKMMMMMMNNNKSLVFWEAKNIIILSLYNR